MRKLLTTCLILFGALSFMAGCQADKVTVKSAGVPPVLAAVKLALVTVSMPDANNLVQIKGAEQSVPVLATVTVTNDITGHSASTAAGDDGSFVLSISGASGDALTIMYTDRWGRNSATASLVVPLDTLVPADPIADLISAYAVDFQGNAVVSGLPGSVEGFATVAITSPSGEIIMVDAGKDGGWTAGIKADPSDSLTIAVFDRYGNPAEGTVLVQVQATVGGLTNDEESNPKGMINGMVFDKATKEPIVGAVVRLSLENGVEMEAVTGTGGTYAFYGVPLAKMLLQSANDHYVQEYYGYIYDLYDVGAINLDKELYQVMGARFWNIRGAYTLSCDTTGKTSPAESSYKAFKVRHADVLFADASSSTTFTDPNITKGIKLIANIDFAFGNLQAEIEGKIVQDIDLAPVEGVTVKIIQDSRSIFGCEGSVCGGDSGSSYLYETYAEYYLAKAGYQVETVAVTNADGMFNAVGIEEGFSYFVIPQSMEWDFVHFQNDSTSYDVPKYPDYRDSDLHSIYAQEGGVVTYAGYFVATEADTPDDEVGPFLISAEPCEGNNVDVNEFGGVVLEFSELLSDCCDPFAQARIVFMGYKGELVGLDFDAGIGGVTGEEALAEVWGNSVPIAQTVTISGNTLTITANDTLEPGAIYGVLFGDPTVAFNEDWITIPIRDRAAVPNVYDSSRNKVLLDKSNFIFFTRGGEALTAIAPRQLPLSADAYELGASGTSLINAFLDEDGVKKWSRAIDGDADLGDVVTTDMLAIDWEMNEMANGYRVFARLNSTMPWVDITDASASASALGYVGRLAPYWAATLTDIGDVMTDSMGYPGVLWDSQWKNGFTIDVIILPIDGDGWLSPYTAADEAKVLTAIDNTFPYIVANATFYGADDDPEDVYAWTLDDALGMTDETNDRLMKDAVGAEDTVTVGFNSMINYAVANFSGSCCEWGLGILAVQFQEKLDAETVENFDIGMSSWQFPLDCDYDSAVQKTDWNLGGSAVPVNAYYPTLNGNTSNIAANEKDAVIKERRINNTDASQILVLVDNIYVLDSGELLLTSGIADIAGNVAGEMDIDIDGDGIVDIADAGFNPFTSFVMAEDVNDRSAVAVDNIPPMIKSITYSEPTTGPGAGLYSVVVELSEKFDPTFSLKTADSEWYLGGLSSDQLNDVDYLNDNALLINMNQIDNTAGNTNDDGLLAINNPGLDLGTEIVTYHVTNAGQTIEFIFGDLSYLSTGGKVELKDICDVEMVEQTGYGTERSCNDSDWGDDSYKFLAQAALKHLGREGAYPALAADGTLADAPETPLNSTIGDVGRIDHLVDIFAPRLVGYRAGEIAALNLSRAANTAAGGNTLTLTVWFTEPMYIGDANADGLNYWTVAGVLADDQDDDDPNSVTNPDNWDLDLNILNWDTEPEDYLTTTNFPNTADLNITDIAHCNSTLPDSWGTDTDINGTLFFDDVILTNPSAPGVTPTGITAAWLNAYYPYGATMWTAHTGDEDILEDGITDGWYQDPISITDIRVINVPATHRNNTKFEIDIELFKYELEVCVDPLDNTGAIVQPGGTNDQYVMCNAYTDGVPMTVKGRNIGIKGNAYDAIPFDSDDQNGDGILDSFVSVRGRYNANVKPMYDMSQCRFGVSRLSVSNVYDLPVPAEAVPGHVIDADNDTWNYSYLDDNHEEYTDGMDVGDNRVDAAGELTPGWLR